MTTVTLRLPLSPVADDRARPVVVGAVVVGALALLLGGGEPGKYGVKDTASDGVVPPVDAVPVQPIGG